MTLTDDLKGAEQRAREAVWNTANALAAATTFHREEGVRADAFTKAAVDAALDRFTVALDRLMAVCRLAGRWDEVRHWSSAKPYFRSSEEGIAADLAKLMEGLG